MNHPQIVSREEWLVAREALLIKEDVAAHLTHWKHVLFGSRVFVV